MLRLLMILALSILLVEPAMAEDPFLVDESSARAAIKKQNEQKDMNFLKSLRKFGVDRQRGKMKNLEGWTNFEDVSGTNYEKKYKESQGVRIRNEISKPLPKREPFGDRLDALEQSINSLGDQNAEEEN